MMSTTSIINRPRFDAEVRCVCVGDEYDNIYSNDLAEQRARYEIYLRSRLHDSITITTVPIYWLDVNWLIDITLPTENTVKRFITKEITISSGVTATASIQLMSYYDFYENSGYAENG